MSDGQPSGCVRVVLPVEGRQREALVFQPSQIHQPSPAVFAFHGAGSSAKEMLNFTRLCDAAVKHQFLAVFPHGTGRVPAHCSWNVGALNLYATRQSVDEDAFIESLLNRLISDFRIDTRRIYTVGMSNGGLLCHLLAARLPHRFAAIASVGCSMIAGQEFQPQGVMPVIHFHGTADPFVPIGGGVGERSFTKSRFAPVRELIDLWVAKNGCRPNPRLMFAGRNAYAGEENCVKIFVFDSLDQDAEVRLVVIPGGGHTWPGQRSKYEFLGPSTDQIDANELIWEFFQRFSLE